MSKPISALTTFQNQTGPIPLSQLDTDFAALWNAANDMATYSNYLVDSSGTPNLITVTPAVGLAFAYAAGIWIEVKVATTNTSTTVNINVNALGNQLLKNPDGSSPAVGQLVAGGIYALQYDGTNFQIIGGAAGGFTGFANPTGTVGLATVNGTATTAMRSDAAPALSQAIAPTWTGVHSFAPAAGIAVTANGVANTYAMRVNGNSTSGQSFGLEVISGTTAADQAFLVKNQTNTQTYLQVNGNGSATFGWNGAAGAISTAATGNVTVNAPSTGVAFTSTGVANSNSLVVTSPSTASQSFGLSVSAGTNAADYSAIFQTAAATSLFEIRGDGAIVIPTAAFFVGNAANGYRFNNAANSVNLFVIQDGGIAEAVDQGGTMQVLGWRDCPNNSQTASYQLALSDRGKSVDFNGASLTCTIPANGTVAFPTGTTIVITNENASSLSIAITTDTLTLAGTTTTGTRTLAQNGMATILKVTSTSWLISGAGLT